MKPTLAEHCSVLDLAWPGWRRPVAAGCSDWRLGLGSAVLGWAGLGWAGLSVNLADSLG